MKLSTTLRKRSTTRFVVAVMVLSLAAAACSSSSDSAGPEPVGNYVDYDASEGGAEAATTVAAVTTVAKDGSVSFETASAPASDAKIIRNGSIDLRIDPGSFGPSAEQIRILAADLGGYVASGESHIEDRDDERYAVGWFTIRIPSDRFDEAVSRVGKIGEEVGSSLSSQDVTEEFVDLEGRLNYWREQEQFYTRLMDEATTIEDLVTLQIRMQDVLLNIEQIEGRLRYLDGRTAFATLTIGLTEVPDTVEELLTTGEPGQIEEAFELAGEVLLGTVAFIIVATAVFVPFAALILLVFLAAKLFVSLRRRKDEPSDS